MKICSINIRGLFPLTLLLLLSSVCFLAFLHDQGILVLRRRLVSQSAPYFNDVDQMATVATSGHVVMTRSCVIPDYDPYNHIAARTLRDPKPDYIGCNTSLPMLTYVDQEWIKVNVTLKQVLNVDYCEYEEIQRRDDFQSEYASPVRFTADVKPGTDFVRVQCFSPKGASGEARKRYTNFHAVIRRKNSVDRRCQLNLNKNKNLRSSSNGLFNCLMIGIDSTSRLNSIRRLNATRQHLFQRQTVELRGYGRVGDNTYPNVMALLTGMFAEERPLGFIDSAPLLWRDFEKVGYRTLFVEDGFIDNHIFDIWVDAMNSPRGFRNVPTDYYFRTLSVAMNDDVEAVSKNRLCIRSTFETELILDWIGDFVKLSGEENDVINQSATSKEQVVPFFAFGFFSSVTHGDHNEAAHVDGYLEQFFRQLQRSGHLENTVVVLFSDHGVRYGTSRGYSRMGWYEENLPMAIVSLPNKFVLQYPEMFSSLRSNSDRLTSPMDLHETVRRLLTLSEPYDDLARSKSRRRGRSLFDGDLGDRTCKQASISPTYCECLLSKTTPLSTKSHQSIKIAHQTVTLMNKLLDRHYHGLCATLRLTEIQEIRLTPQQQSKETTVDDVDKSNYYTLTYKTSPGDGLFQAIVLYANNTISFDGPADILRLNSYSKNAGCNRHIVHKKWCYCVKKIV